MGAYQVSRLLSSCWTQHFVTWPNEMDFKIEMNCRLLSCKIWSFFVDTTCLSIERISRNAVMDCIYSKAYRGKSAVYYQALPEFLYSGYFRNSLALWFRFCIFYIVKLVNLVFDRTRKPNSLIKLFKQYLNLAKEMNDSQGDRERRSNSYLGSSFYNALSKMKWRSLILRRTGKGFNL
jgi:hypothetical protein